MKERAASSYFPGNRWNYRSRTPSLVEMVAFPCYALIEVELNTSCVRCLGRTDFKVCVICAGVKDRSSLGSGMGGKFGNFPRKRKTESFKMIALVIC